MPSTSIIFGILLILIGLIGYVYGMINGNASLTALIPAVFGIILAVLGFVGKSKETLRKHVMHAAVLIGLLGFLATVSSFLKIPALFAGTAERPSAVVAQAAMASICLVFVVLCIKSFIDARKNRVA
jgi:hypothetical protein